MRENMNELWYDLGKMNKVRPYVFKTRLNRAILRTKRYADEKSDVSLKLLCDQLEMRMKYISDQSNQTSDGELRSFLVLKDDIEKIRNEVQKNDRLEEIQD